MDYAALDRLDAIADLASRVVADLKCELEREAIAASAKAYKALVKLPTPPQLLSKARRPVMPSRPERRGLR